MIKLRVQGTSIELKRMYRVLEKQKSISILSLSDMYPNKGTNKYCIDNNTYRIIIVNKFQFSER